MGIRIQHWDLKFLKHLNRVLIILGILAISALFQKIFNYRYNITVDNLKIVEQFTVGAWNLGLFSSR